MYFYQGDAWTYGDTGYATSSNGTDWTMGNKVMQHGGYGFTNVNALISDIVPVTLSNGQPGLRAYCSGMQSTGGDVPTSIFIAESTDLYGLSWNIGSVIVNGSNSSGQVGNPRVLVSDSGYTMYYNRSNAVYRTTSTDGLADWSPPQSVVTGVGGFDIVFQDGEFSMFAQVNTGGYRNVIRSLSSSDGINWEWDSGDKLVPEPFVGDTGAFVSGPALANINGVDRMYISARPIYYHPNTLSNIYSAMTVPEPATILMLSLGGLALLRKRRK
jgi:hypothetical protein